MNVAAASIWDAQNHHQLRSREEESQEDHFLYLSLSLLCGRKVTFQTIGGDLKSTIKHDWSCELGGWIFSMSYLLHLSSFYPHICSSSGASSSSSSNFIPKFIIIDGHQPTTSLLALSNCRYVLDWETIFLF